MMLATLPRRNADDLSGELFVEAYERQLSKYPRLQIEYLCDKAIETCKWFPTVADCHEICEKWYRADEHTKRRNAILTAINIERQQRKIDRQERDPWVPKPGELEEIKRQVAESLKA